MHIKSRSYQLKGQLEAVVVFGLIIVGVIIVILSSQQAAITQPSPIPAHLEQTQQEVEQLVTSMLSTVTHNSLVTLELYGGYINPHEELSPELVTEFMFRNVSVWQVCMAEFSPSLSDMEQRMEDMITAFILDDENIHDFESDGGEVVFDKTALTVEVEIFDNEIKVSVFLPTTINGYEMPQPYIFTLPSKFGRIVKFAKDLTAELAANRSLEVFARNRIDNTPLPGPYKYLTRGLLFECGDSFYVPAAQLNNELEDKIVASLGITMWQDPGYSDGYPTQLAILEVNGETYEDIQPEFRLRPTFRVTGSGDINVQNDGSTSCLGDVCFLGNCFGCTSDLCGPVRYWNAFEVGPYPVIIRVLDDVTNTHFTFATIIHIEATTDDVADVQEFIQYAIDSMGTGAEMPFKTVIEILPDGRINDDVAEGIIDQMEPWPIEPGEPQRLMCWYDTDGSGAASTGDMFWVSPNSACIFSSEDVAVAGAPTEGQEGEVVDNSVGNINYLDTTPPPDGNDAYDTDPRERVFIDSTQEMLLDISEALDIIGADIQSDETRSAVESAMEDVKKMVAGTCGLEGVS